MVSETSNDNFDDIVADVEPEVDLSGFPKLPPGHRRSIKYLVESETVWHSYVFAPDPFEAETIAREMYKIPDDDDVKITRVIEGGVDKARYSKGSHVIHPD